MRISTIALWAILINGWAFCPAFFGQAPSTPEVSLSSNDGGPLGPLTF